MLVPMSPTSSIFLLAESRQRPMHVAGLQLFRPPDGASAVEVRDAFYAASGAEQVAPVFRKRARRGITTLGQWGWDAEHDIDLEHHVRCDALPHPGRVRELLALCSRLHSTLLDRQRPLWEAHLIEGLADGRFAVYFKIHHALADGTHLLALLAGALGQDPGQRGMPAPWALQRPLATPDASPNARGPADAHGFARWVEDAAGLGPALVRTVRRALDDQGAALSLRAPHSILNVTISASRRFAAQSWPVARIKAVGERSGTTVNDVVLAMCSGALRAYLTELDALPGAPLVAMVPVALHADGTGSDGGGNAVGLVMCNLGTTEPDPAGRLELVHRSMAQGKRSLEGMSRLQILAMSALGIGALGVYPLLRLDGVARPPFNLVISNLPGPAQPLFWNGARLDGLFPLSIPTDGQALNITCTSYAGQLSFGLTGCRRAVPHLQRLLAHLEHELCALEDAVGVPG